ncbi:hypothetical protein [Streptomyces mayteni]
MRLDTGGPCGPCEDVRDNRRSLRLGIAADVAIAMPAPQFTAGQRRAEVERRMREFTHEQLAVAAKNREQDAAARARDEAAWEAAAPQREAARAAARAAYEADLAAQRALPCVDCGAADASGLCATCVAARDAEDLIVQAGDVAASTLPGWDGTTTPDGALEVARRTQRRIRSELAAALEEARAAGATTETLALLTRLVADRALAELRAAALAALARSPQAQAEGWQAAEAERRSPHHQGTAVNEAAALATCLSTARHWVTPAERREAESWIARARSVRERAESRRAARTRRKDAAPPPAQRKREPTRTQQPPKNKAKKSPPPGPPALSSDALAGMSAAVTGALKKAARERTTTSWTRLRRALGSALPDLRPDDQLTVLLHIDQNTPPDEPLLAVLLASTDTNPPHLYRDLATRLGRDVPLEANAARAHWQKDALRLQHLYRYR